MMVTSLKDFFVLGALKCLDLLWLNFLQGICYKN